MHARITHAYIRIRPRSDSVLPTPEPPLQRPCTRPAHSTTPTGTPTSQPYNTYMYTHIHARTYMHAHTYARMHTHTPWDVRTFHEIHYEIYQARKLHEISWNIPGLGVKFARIYDFTWISPKISDFSAGPRCTSTAPSLYSPTWWCYAHHRSMLKARADGGLGWDTTQLFTFFCFPESRVEKTCIPCYVILFFG